jgi:hypothetical protein
MKPDIESLQRPLGRKEAARYITVKFCLPMAPMTLEAFASKGGGPVYCKTGRRVFYKKSDLEAWVDMRRSQKVCVHIG